MGTNFMQLLRAEDSDLHKSGPTKAGLKPMKLVVCGGFNSLSFKSNPHFYTLDITNPSLAGHSETEAKTGLAATFAAVAAANTAANIEAGPQVEADATADTDTDADANLETAAGAGADADAGAGVEPHRESSYKWKQHTTSGDVPNFGFGADQVFELAGGRGCATFPWIQTSWASGNTVKGQVGFESLYELEFATERWTQQKLRGRHPCPRTAFATATSADGRLVYVFGGHAAMGSPIGDMHVLDMKSRTRTMLPIATDPNHDLSAAGSVINPPSVRRKPKKRPPSASYGIVCVAPKPKSRVRTWSCDVSGEATAEMEEDIPLSELVGCASSGSDEVARPLQMARSKSISPFSSPSTQKGFLSNPAPTQAPLTTVAHSSWPRMHASRDSAAAAVNMSPSKDEYEWAQCDRCEKWRRLHGSVDAAMLPDPW